MEFETIIYDDRLAHFRRIVNRKIGDWYEEYFLNKIFLAESLPRNFRIHWRIGKFCYPPEFFAGLLPLKNPV